MKIFVVCDVFNLAIQISIKNVFVVYQKRNWKKEKLSNAFTAVVEAALANACTRLSLSDCTDLFHFVLFIVKKKHIRTK